MSPQLTSVLWKFIRCLGRYVCPPFYRFLHPAPAYELSVLRVFLMFASFVVILNEYACFWLAFMRWPSLEQHMAKPDADHLRILLVADPQIVGYQNEGHLFSPITRWDSDKYLKKSYSFAMSYVQPEVVVFLGDLFDEGSIASDKDFQHYVNRFRMMFPVPPNVKVAYLPGDNDVGGEGVDAFSESKQRRFESHFGKFLQTHFAVKFVDFVPIRFAYHEAFDVTAHEPLAAQLTSPIRVLLNHFTMLRCRAYPHKIQRAPVHVMNLFKSSLSFTGDIHKARYDFASLHDREESCTATSLIGRNNLTSFQLTDRTWHEIVSPTCNYRMGVSNMGFTVATISRSGHVDVLLLWLPGRFGYLFLYLFLLIFLVVQFIYFKCGMGSVKLKEMPP